jgi:hypothetical protein
VGSISAAKSISGDHTITATDAQKNLAIATFTIASITPDTPIHLSPKNGARLSLLGDIKPTFKWSPVTNDPNGVTYTLQIDTSSNFSSPIIEKDNLTGTSYSLTDNESLPRGKYYWRVQAIDSASNESSWSQGFSLKSGLMALWTLVLIIILCVLAVIALAYLIVWLLFIRRRKAVVVPSFESSPALGEWHESRPEESHRQLASSWIKALPRSGKMKKLSPEEQARFKLIVDFVQSVPLIEPGFTADWMVSLVESDTGTVADLQTYKQLLDDQLQIHYEPGWTRHPLYLELKTVLGDHQIVKEMDSFVDAVNRCGIEGVTLLREIYRDCLTEVPTGFLDKGGWGFISGIYADSIGWFRGKSLQEPSERDYAIRRPSYNGNGNFFSLYGEDSTSFAGPLFKAQDEQEVQQLRTLHLKLRRSYRNNERAKQLVSIITQTQLQQQRLASTLAQVSQSPE